MYFVNLAPIITWQCQTQVVLQDSKYFHSKWIGFSKVSSREHEVKGYKYVRIFLFSFQYIPNEVSIKPSAKEDDKGNPCFITDKLVKVMLFGVFMLDTGLQGFFKLL